MIRLVSIILVALFAAGCWNDNTLTITNRANASVNVVMRGEEHTIAAGASQKLTDIPSGTFEYSTVYTLPVGAKSATAGSGLSGELSFYNNATQYILIYASTLLDSVYAISATLSSTDDKSIVH